MSLGLSRLWPNPPLFALSWPVYAHPKLSEPSPSTPCQTWTSGSILSQLVSNTSLNPLTPLCLDNTFPTLYPFLTWHSFDLSPSSCQVDSRHPHSFPIWHHSTFSLLHQVYSQCFIGLMTAVGQSPIAYLPRSMCPSLSFPALYISVCFSMSHHSLPFVCFLHLILSSPSLLTLV